MGVGLGVIVGEGVGVCKINKAGLLGVTVEETAVWAKTGKGSEEDRGAPTPHPARKVENITIPKNSERKRYKF
ncbi:MAG: hypothetical protein OHK0041_11100 [Anaerolineales bacterium]